MKKPNSIALDTSIPSRGGVDRENRPRIAICDYVVTDRSPIGSCHLALLRRLCDVIDFTVFAAEFENPRPDRIRFVRVPAPTRPLALLYIVYQIAILPIFFWVTRIKGHRFDLVQSTETYSFIGDISYSHFCHSHYLRKHWAASSATGVSRLARWVDHRLRSLTEGFVYRRVRAVVVPSRGLERELREEFATPPDRITVIPNPVDLSRFARPSNFDARSVLQNLGVSPGDVVASFVALGHFERKGLPYIFSAMQRMREPSFKLLIVGGRDGLISEYRRQADELGIGEKVVFIGMQADVRPYFWSSDFFLFPSLYETFSLVTHQAAASGLPIVVSRLHGVEDLIRDGENGFLIDTSVEGVEEGLARILRLGSDARGTMGRRAQLAVSICSEEHFVEMWLEFYEQQGLARGRLVG